VIAFGVPRWTDPCQAVKDDRDRLAALLGDVAGALTLALVGPTDEDREACERILARAREVLS
jgi:hypothetical protein